MGQGISEKSKGKNGNRNQGDRKGSRDRRDERHTREKWDKRHNRRNAPGQAADPRRHNVLTATAARSPTVSGL